jgi:peroxiredoxin
MSTPTQPLEPPHKPPASKVGQSVKLFAAIAALIVAGFMVWRQLTPEPGRNFYKFDSATFAFVDHARSNTELDGCDVGSLDFVSIDGKPVDLRLFRGQRNVVLVVTRGNTSGTGPGAYDGNICLYCATQTSRLIANYQAFRDHDAEVVVVFPIRQVADSGSVSQFHEALRRDGTTAEPPFPLVLDVELRAVDQLGIRADLSKPATYILDKQGQVRFAYVGATIADRPSIQSMLEQLAAVNADAR